MAAGSRAPKVATPIAEQEPVTAPAAAEEAPAWAKLLIDRIDRLEGEVRATKARTPAFVPKQPMPGHKPGGVFAALNEAIGGPGRRGWGEKWGQGVSNVVLVDIHGEKIPDQMLSRLAPQFGDGDQVRINPEVAREGFPDGQTWGDVLAKVGSEGYGTVKKVYWLTDAGQWKYSVVVPGVTGARPDGFHDYELLPA